MPNEESRSSQTVAIHGFYDPSLSQGAAVMPAFHTSTYVADSPELLHEHFKQAYGVGRDACNPDGLIYSRLVHPNVEVYERRFAYLEGGEEAALVPSGMSAISLVMDEFCEIGDTVLFSAPVYGGTDHMFHHVLPDEKRRRVRTVSFPVQASVDEIRAIIEKYHPIRIVYIETPSNPTLLLADIVGIAQAVKKKNPETIIVVDSTILSPIFIQPLKLGADIVVHSATKIINGHSDVVAGIVVGSSCNIKRIKARRTITGPIPGALTALFLLRSLPTLKVRALAQCKSSVRVANFLRAHNAVAEVFYPGFGNMEQERRFEDQCTGPGQLMSFRIRGGRKEAYEVLRRFNTIKLAVSLGGVESLAEHPATHTHLDVSPEDQKLYGITDDLIRLSVGLESTADLIADLDHSLLAVR